MSEKDWGNIFNTHGNRLIFEFESYEAANGFKLWLCESGEQHYWNWQEHSEEEYPEEEKPTGLDFDYHSGTDVIKVKCGRLEKP